MSLDRPRQHYDRAPIVEAIIDIQVEVPDATQTAPVDALAESLRGRYASRLPIHQAQMRLDLDKEGPAAVSNEHSILGWRFDTEKKDRVLQIRRGGLTYSHLEPYTDWETFRSEAKPVWEEYLAATKPSAVRRMAVRVINRMPEMPEGAQIKDYFNLLPVIPATLPQSVDGIFLQIRMGYAAADPDAKLIANLYSDQTRPNQLIFDIDLFVERRVDPSHPTVFETVDNLGYAKDAVFEACITDKVRELIQ